MLSAASALALAAIPLVATSTNVPIVPPTSGRDGHSGALSLVVVTVFVIPPMGALTPRGDPRKMIVLSNRGPTAASSKLPVAASVLIPCTRFHRQRAQRARSAGGDGAWGGGAEKAQDWNSGEVEGAQPKGAEKGDGDEQEPSKLVGINRRRT